MSEEQARVFVDKLLAALEPHIGPYAAALKGPLMAIPALQVVAIAQQVHARFHEIEQEEVTG